MNKKMVDSIGSMLMTELNARRAERIAKELPWAERVEKLHAEIRANPSAKFRDCDEDNQHPYWEPAFPLRRK